MASNPITRIQRNILAAGERRLLTWIAARLPMSVTPDRLTTLGFFGAVGVGAGFALSTFNHAWLWFAVACFFINWFGDSLDGSLARFRKIERPDFGYFIDHSTDALGNLFIVGGIGLSPYVRLDLALVGLAAYLLLSIHTFLAARVIDEFNLTYLAGGPTEMRLLLIALAIAMYFVGPHPLLGFTSDHAAAGWSAGLTVFDGVIGIMTTILLLIFVVQTARLGNRLRRRGR